MLLDEEQGKAANVRFSKLSEIYVGKHQLFNAVAQAYCDRTSKGSYNKTYLFIEPASQDPLCTTQSIHKWGDIFLAVALLIRTRLVYNAIFVMLWIYL